MNLSKEYTINYIIAFNISTYRVPSYVSKFEDDPLFFIRIHKEFLDTCDGTHISMGTFVINDDIKNDTKEQIKELVAECKIPTTVVFRENGAFSYGIWNDTIINTIDNYDYFFMIEDDYVPDEKDFYIPFVQRIKDDTPYVCGLILYQPLHAAHSNGIVSQKACKKVMETNENLFDELSGDDKHSAVHTQLFFLRNFQKLGYNLADITDKYLTRHIANYHGVHPLIDEYGVVGGRCLIKPIIVGDE
jgi:hypothetical protein